MGWRAATGLAALATVASRLRFTTAAAPAVSRDAGRLEAALRDAGVR